jgi:hypothetical protein
VGKKKVIQGWDQGLIGMKKGGKRCLCVPASLGYGAAGSGEQIPANAALIFTIELTKHKSKDGKSSESAAAAPVAASTPDRPRADSTATIADVPVEEDPAAARKAALLERMSKMGHSMGADGQQQQQQQMPGQQMPGQQMPGQFGGQQGNMGMQGQPGMMGMQGGQPGMQGQFPGQQGMHPGQQGMMGMQSQGQMMGMQHGMPGQQSGNSQALAIAQPTQQALYDQFGNMVQVPGHQLPPQQQATVLYDAYGNAVQMPPQAPPAAASQPPPQTPAQTTTSEVAESGAIAKKLDEANAKLDKLTVVADKQSELLACVIPPWPFFLGVCVARVAPCCAPSRIYPYRPFTVMLTIHCCPAGTAPRWRRRSSCTTSNG